MRLKEEQHFEGKVLTYKAGLPSAFGSVITQNDRMIQLVKYLETMAHTSRSILITGDYGTGKGDLAQCIHQCSNAEGQYISLDTANMDEVDFSHLLFGVANHLQSGHENHTLPTKAKGTLFIDEISEMPSSCQTKLLSFLNQKEARLLSQNEGYNKDFRLVVSSSKPIKKLVIADRFNKALYYRLKCHQVHLPSLAQRKDDLALLLNHYIQSGAETLGIEVPAFECGIIKILEEYDFPGNLRELEAIIFNSLCRLAGEQNLREEDFTREIQQCRHDNLNAPTLPRSSFLKDLGSNEQLPTIDNCIDVLIEKTLVQNDRNQTASAKSLGITRQGLLARIKRKKKLMI
jgi:DNA-binding NtrC family response regulator